MTVLRPLLVGLLGACVLAAVACRGARPRSEKSFDEIRDLVADRSAAEIESLLGAPDTRQPILLGDERWIWWSYTYLDGNGYPPEMRGHVVHLEILFERPEGSRAERPPDSAWRVSGPLGVSYTLPGAGGG